MSMHSLWSKTVYSFIVVLLANSAYAAPWVEPGDARLRHHLSILSDAGIIQTPVTSWPLMWGGIAADLYDAESHQLSNSQYWSLSFVRFMYNQSKQSLGGGYLGVRSDENAVAGFDLDQRDKAEARGSIEWLGDRIAARVQGKTVKDPIDGDDVRYDGSFFSGLMGNWALSVGAIDKWWGPGWQSSLILSNNARPIDSIILQRNFSDPFDVPILEWIGHWSLTAFIGRLEHSRFVPDAKLVGARFSFRPISSLEVGLSRTAQWGGEDRPEDLSSLWSLAIGKDNRGDDGIDDSNEPGNQIGSIDWRLSGNLFSNSSAVYMQYAGEDESGAFPSLGFYLYGIETAFISGSASNRIYLEYAETTAGDNQYNVAYEHSVYKTGYRYLQRPIGASFDNDSEVVVLGGLHYFSNGDELSWKYMELKLNVDGVDRGAAVGGSVFGEKRTETPYIEIKYGKIVHDFKVTMTVSHVDNKISWNSQDIEGAGFAIGVEYKGD